MGIVYSKNLQTLPTEKSGLLSDFTENIRKKNFSIEVPHNTSILEDPKKYRYYTIDQNKEIIKCVQLKISNGEVDQIEVDINQLKNENQTFTYPFPDFYIVNGKKFIIDPNSKAGQLLDTFQQIDREYKDYIDYSSYINLLDDHKQIEILSQRLLIQINNFSKWKDYIEFQKYIGSPIALPNGPPFSLNDIVEFLHSQYTEVKEITDFQDLEKMYKILHTNIIFYAKFININIALPDPNHLISSKKLKEFISNHNDPSKIISIKPFY